MRIGFLSNQLDNRGTGNALFNYAHYNEDLLGNESAIYTFSNGNHQPDVIDKFEDRFDVIKFADRGEFPGIDALYHIKSGMNDGFKPDVPYLVHAVFDNQPHGDRYATISPWMGQRYNLPYVPHIVEIADTNKNLREELDIPESAVVFGRYGGADSFDIVFVWETINKFAAEHENAYFIFMNTNEPGIDLLAPEKFRFLPPTVDAVRKREFINTCDAMLHARARGETFGIAVGEFALASKPVLTYSLSSERAHIYQIGHLALLYETPSTLVGQMKKVMRGPLVSWGYGQYTPENVMQKFREVFLR